MEYFKKGLSDFTYDVANGGAVRHLTDLGYTVKQIAAQLDYPASYERIQNTVWEHLCDTGVLLLDEPGSGKARERAVYVRDYDKYGRTSFRKVVIQDASFGEVCFKEWHYNEDVNGNFGTYLADKCKENDEEASYISCSFGIWYRRDPKAFAKAMQLLDERQRDYITGLPWKEKICCHRLDRRMREIAIRLYCGGKYHGACWFLKTGEKLVI